MTISQMWAEPDPYDVIQHRRFESMLSRFSPDKDEKAVKAFVLTAGHTHYGRLLRDMFDAAKAYAKSERMSPYDFNGPLTKAAELCNDLRAASSYYKGEFETKLDFPPKSKIWRDNLKYIEKASYGRDEIEHYVGEYLRLPFRSPVMERTLAVLLMWYEASHFVEEMYKSVIVPLKRHVLVSILIELVVSAIILGGAAFLAGYLHEQGKMNIGWANWITIGSLGVLALIIASDICLLPFAWRRQRRARKLIGGMINTMADAYNELDSSGPVSANRVHELVTKAADLGVVWPSSLFPLLEDIRKRDGKF